MPAGPGAGRVGRGPQRVRNDGRPLPGAVGLKSTVSSAIERHEYKGLDFYSIFNQTTGGHSEV